MMPKCPLCGGSMLPSHKTCITCSRIKPERLLLKNGTLHLPDLTRTEMYLYRKLTVAQDEVARLTHLLQEQKNYIFKLRKKK